MKRILSAVVLMMFLTTSVYAGSFNDKNNPKYQTGGLSTGFPTSMCKPIPGTGVMQGEVNYTMVDGQKVPNPIAVRQWFYGYLTYGCPSNATWYDKSTVKTCFNPNKDEYYQNCTGYTS